MHACKNLIVAASLACALPWAAGQTVYRCGNSYSQLPCPGATSVQAADPRTATDARRSEHATAADVRRAQALEHERLAQERKGAQAGTLSAPPPAPVRAAQAPAPHKKRQDKDKAAGQEPFTAVVPRPAGDPGGKAADKGKKD